MDCNKRGNTKYSMMKLIDVDWDYLSIYNVYFNDDYDINYVINNNTTSRDDIINDVLIDKLENWV